MVEAIIRLVERNRLLSAAWGLFTACFFFLVHETYTGDQQLAALRTGAERIERSQAELDIAIDAVNLHTTTSLALAKSATDLKAAPGGPAPDLDLAIQTFRAHRLKAQQTRVALDALYVESPTLKEVIASAIKDMDDADAFLERRISSLVAFRKNPLAPPADLDEMRANLDGQRGMAAATARDAARSRLLERARREHNVAVATYNAEGRMYRMRSMTRVAAWGYFGGIIGAALGGVLYRRRRKRRLATAERPEPSWIRWILPTKETPMSNREVVDTGSDKRYVRRDDKGQFTEDQVNVGKSSAADQRQHSTTPAKKGQGDRGDRQS